MSKSFNKNIIAVPDDIYKLQNFMKKVSSFNIWYVEEESVQSNIDNLTKNTFTINANNSIKLFNKLIDDNNKRHNIYMKENCIYLEYYNNKEKAWNMYKITPFEEIFLSLREKISKMSNFSVAKRLLDKGYTEKELRNKSRAIRKAILLNEMKKEIIPAS